MINIPKKINPAIIIPLSKNARSGLLAILGLADIKYVYLIMM